MTTDGYVPACGWGSWEVVAGLVAGLLLAPSVNLWIARVWAWLRAR